MPKALLRVSFWKTCLAGGALASALVAVLAWPALATILEAVAPASGDLVGGGGGLMLSLGDEGLARPLALAGETLKLVFLTEAIALPVGIPLGFLLFRTNLWGRRGWLALMAISAFVPMPLHATAWLGAFGNVGRSQLFGSSPFLVGVVGAAVVHAVAAIPWVVILAGVGLRSVEPELEESAQMDLSGWRVVTSVTLRRGAWAIAGAALAVAVLTAGDMTVTDLLQVRTYAEEAYLQYQLGGGPAAAGTVALPPLLVLGILLLVVEGTLLRADPRRIASAARAGKVWRLGRSRVVVGLATGLVVGGLVAVPFGSLVWRAGRVGGVAARGQAPHWSPSGLYGSLRSALFELTGISEPEPAPSTSTGGRPTFVQALTGPEAGLYLRMGWEEGVATVRRLASSPLATSLFCSALAASFAVAIAWCLVWSGREPGPWRVVGVLCVALALAVPGPVSGMALVLAYRNIPDFYDSMGMIVLAGVLRTLPYAWLVLWPAARALPPELLESATLDGLDSFGLATRVAVPTTRGAIIAAWSVAFVLAFGELPATNPVTPPGITPVTVVIWGLLHTGVESHLSGVVLVVLAAVAIFGLSATWALARLQGPSAED